MPRSNSSHVRIYEGLRLAGKRKQGVMRVSPSELGWGRSSTAEVDPKTVDAYLSNDSLQTDTGTVTEKGSLAVRGYAEMNSATRHFFAATSRYTGNSSAS